MSDGIRIDNLDQTMLPSLQHSIPAMRDGLTVRLTVEQIAEVAAATNRLARADLSNTSGPRGRWTPPMTAADDLNNFSENGHRYYPPGAPNSPVPAESVLVSCVVAGEPDISGNFYCVQRARAIAQATQTDTLVWQRFKWFNSWSSWHQVEESQSELDARYVRNADHPWKTILNLTVGTAVPSIIVPNLSAYKSLRIYTKFWPTVNDTQMMARFSIDGGTTYKQAADNYSNTYLGNQTGSTPFNINNALESFARLSATATTNAPGLGDIRIDVAEGGTVVVYGGTFTGQHSTNGGNLVTVSGYMRSASGPLTNIMFYPLAGQIGVKTQVFVEGLA